MTQQTQVPASAELFATALIADRELRDEVLGDLIEEYDRRSYSAKAPNAAWWYWSQLVRSAIPLSNMAVARGGRRGRALHVLGVVTGSVAMYVIVVLGAMLTGRLKGVILTPATLTALRVSYGHPTFGAAPPMWLVGVISLAIAVFAGAVSSYIAASIGRRSPVAPALTLCTVYIGFLYVLPLLMGGAARKVVPIACLLAGVMAGVLLKARVLRTELS
jgi:hypothetical protein